MSGVTLSPKHGVNPSMGICFFCQEDSGDVILCGRLPGDEEAPRRMCVSLKPCPKCRGYMEIGIILISVDENKTTNPNNPHRTGGWVVLKEEAVRRMLSGDLLEGILRKRMAFVPDDAWEKMGLPKPNGGSASLAPKNRMTT